MIKKLLKITSTVVLSTFIIIGTANAATSGNVKQMPKLNQNTYTLDYKYFDADGDKVKDNIILSGIKDKPSDMYFHDINIIFENGKTKKITKLEFGKYSGGYDGNLYLGDFNSDNVSDALVIMSSGGSSGMIEYKIVSFKKGTPKLITMNKQLTDVVVKFIPNFKAQLSSKMLNKKDTINLSINKDKYIKSVIYDKNGNLKENITTYAEGFCKLTPAKLNNKEYALVGYQCVRGISNADLLGYIVTTWKYNGKSMKLEIDNVKIEQILARKQADINGDGKQDYLQLLGQKTLGDNSSYMTNIKIKMYDGEKGETNEAVFEDVKAIFGI